MYRDRNQKPTPYFKYKMATISTWYVQWNINRWCTDDPPAPTFTVQSLNDSIRRVRVTHRMSQNVWISNSPICISYCEEGIFRGFFSQFCNLSIASQATMATPTISFELILFACVGDFSSEKNPPKNKLMKQFSAETDQISGNMVQCHWTHW